MTQASSAARLKFVKLGDSDLKKLYQQFDMMSTVDFQQYCQSVVNSGSGGKAKKYTIVSKIEMMVEKKSILKITQDFILAGMGLGV